MALRVAGRADAEAAEGADVRDELVRVAVLIRQGEGRVLGDVPAQGEHVLDAALAQLGQDLAHALLCGGNARQVRQGRDAAALDLAGDLRGEGGGAAPRAVCHGDERRAQGRDLARDLLVLGEQPPLLGREQLAGERYLPFLQALANQHVRIPSFRKDFFSHYTPSRAAVQTPARHFLHGARTGPFPVERCRFRLDSTENPPKSLEIAQKIKTFSEISKIYGKTSFPLPPSGV